MTISLIPGSEPTLAGGNCDPSAGGPKTLP